MKTLEESITDAMDGTNSEIVRYLPYILQDFWEIGADPETIIALIQAHTRHYDRLKVLDLGCGKGAVSVKIAHRLGCQCLGYDAVESFVYDARQKAQEYNVQDLCSFDIADIRLIIKELSAFDIIILGAIGPVLGSYLDTFRTLSPCVNPNGLIIIDDGYILGHGDFSHPRVVTRSQLLQQATQAQMKLVDERIYETNSHVIEDHEKEFNFLAKRCRELISKYPENSTLFEDYIRDQKKEYHNMENHMVCSTMVFAKA